jgi:hypothetical protein
LSLAKLCAALYEIGEKLAEKLRVTPVLAQPPPCGISIRIFGWASFFSWCSLLISDIGARALIESEQILKVKE